MIVTVADVNLQLIQSLSIKKKKKRDLPSAEELVKANFVFYRHIGRMAAFRGCELHKLVVRLLNQRR
jgi:hypothetical protein